jgi:ectoine hydroxylase-related dioxygenase (phytanoyl-CoA dioxygenase family)
MPRVPEKPAESLTNEQIDAFWRDGVICIRNLYSSDWVDRLRSALDHISSSPNPVFGEPRPGDDYHGVYAWFTDDTIRDFVLQAPSAWIAQQAFRSRRINFFYDQIFIKRKLSPNPTPWHHDFTFWPLEGEQIASLWTSVDAVDVDASALEFVKGSHRWPKRFRAIGIDGTDVTTGKDMDELPDMAKDRDKYDIVSWAVEPGDALLFHALTLHGARGNSSAKTGRRAITTRWCGDDVRYALDKGLTPYRHDLKVGDALSGYLFPGILPNINESDLARRDAGPILPDPVMLEATMKFHREANKVPITLERRPGNA